MLMVYPPFGSGGSISTVRSSTSDGSFAARGPYSMFSFTTQSRPSHEIDFFVTRVRPSGSVPARLASAGSQ